MIEGAAWRRWVFYNIPLILFVFVLLFPFYWMIITTFRPDGELYRPWNAINYQPFWTNNPTLEHIKYLFEETSFARWMFNTCSSPGVDHHRCSAACWRAMRWPGQRHAGSWEP
jgi:multiple sugar transport system permease protein